MGFESFQDAKHEGAATQSVALLTENPIEVEGPFLEETTKNERHKELLRSTVNATEPFEKFLEMTDRKWEGGFKQWGNRLPPWARKMVGLGVVFAGVVLMFVPLVPFVFSIPFLLAGALLYHGSKEKALAKDPELFIRTKGLFLATHFVFIRTPKFIGRKIAERCDGTLAGKIGTSVRKLFSRKPKLAR